MLASHNMLLMDLLNHSLDLMIIRSLWFWYSEIHKIKRSKKYSNHQIITKIIIRTNGIWLKRTEWCYLPLHPKSGSFTNSADQWESLPIILEKNPKYRRWRECNMIKYYLKLLEFLLEIIWKTLRKELVNSLFVTLLKPNCYSITLLFRNRTSWTLTAIWFACFLELLQMVPSKMKKKTYILKVY